jgi:hypothetical protein
MKVDKQIIFACEIQHHGVLYAEYVFKEVMFTGPILASLPITKFFLSPVIFCGLP